MTVDVCEPLPCNYNRILTPDSGALLPSDISYITDNVAKSTTFGFFMDEVSLRCYDRTYNVYTNLCGPKIYAVERLDGTRMPPTAGVTTTCNAGT